MMLSSVEKIGVLRISLSFMVRAKHAICRLETGLMVSLELATVRRMRCYEVTMGAPVESTPEVI